VDEKEPKLLLSQNPYWCLEEECKNYKSFKNAIAFGTHIHVVHTSKVEYAKKHKTCEYVVCKTCGKEVYRTFLWQAHREGRFTCIDPKCTSRKENISERVKRFKVWCKNNPEKTREIAKNGRATMRIRGTDKIAIEKQKLHRKLYPKEKKKCKQYIKIPEELKREHNRQGSIKGWETRRKNGNVESGIEHLKQWSIDHPEEKKQYSQNAADARRANGGYDFDIMSRISRKGWEHAREDPVKFENRINHSRQKRRECLKKKYGRYSSLFPMFSLESQELFIGIEENLRKELTCYYAIKENENFGALTKDGKKTSGEYQVWVHGNRYVRFLDFFVKELNVCIEFDEEHHEKEKVKKEDLIRENDIKRAAPDIKIFRVKKVDYLADKNKILKECLDFIYRCAEHSLHSQQSTELAEEHQVPLEVI
jgi:hypothetical protein